MKIPTSWAASGILFPSFSNISLTNNINITKSDTFIAKFWDWGLKFLYSDFNSINWMKKVMIREKINELDMLPSNDLTVATITNTRDKFNKSKIIFRLNFIRITRDKVHYLSFWNVVNNRDCNCNPHATKHEWSEHTSKHSFYKRHITAYWY